MGLINQTQKSYYEGADGVQNSGDEIFGGYQFISLKDIINQFTIAYVGENKIISKIKRADIAFHAQRALQELSFDTFKSSKSLEMTVPATLKLPLPIDYINYTALSWVDDAGVKRYNHYQKHLIQLLINKTQTDRLNLKQIVILEILL